MAMAAMHRSRARTRAQSQCQRRRLRARASDRRLGRTHPGDTDRSACNAAGCAKACRRPVHRRWRSHRGCRRTGVGSAMLLSDEQRMIRDAVREFVQAQQIQPFAADWDRDHHFPREQLQHNWPILACSACSCRRNGAVAVRITCRLRSPSRKWPPVTARCRRSLSVNNSVVCGVLLSCGNDWQKENSCGRWQVRARSLGCFLPDRSPRPDRTPRRCVRAPNAW